MQNLDHVTAVTSDTHPVKNFHLLNLHRVLFLSLECKLNTPKINSRDNHRARVECICDMHKWHTELNVVCHVWEREQSTIVRKTTDGFHVLQQSHPHFVTTSQYVGIIWFKYGVDQWAPFMLYRKLVAEQTYKKGPWHSLLSTTSCVCLPSKTAWHYMWKDLTGLFSLFCMLKWLNIEDGKDSTVFKHVYLSSLIEHNRRNYLWCSCAIYWSWNACLLSGQ